MILFRDQYNRNPTFESKEDDIKKLIEIKQEVLNKHQVVQDKLKEDIFDLIFDEIAPVCAVVGGVIAQEVIKAVSHKELPIYNLFLLNPHTFQGKEETIGIL